MTEADGGLDIGLPENHLDFLRSEDLTWQTMLAPGKLHVSRRIRGHPVGKREPPEESLDGQKHLDLRAPTKRGTILLSLLVKVKAKAKVLDEGQRVLSPTLPS